MLVHSCYMIIIISTPNATIGLGQLWLCFTKDLQILCCCTRSFEKKKYLLQFPVLSISTSNFSGSNGYHTIVKFFISPYFAFGKGQ